jgi:outer membrane protein assembly factor BamB
MNHSAHRPHTPRSRRAWPQGLAILGLWIATSLGLSAAAWGEDSYFRRHGGVAVGDKPLPSQFDETTRVWRTELPPGHSSPCVNGDQIFLTTYRAERPLDEALQTVALHRRTGDILWRREAGAERLEPVHPIGSPASATVACNGRQVFSFFGSHGLLCYDLDGKLLWQRSLGPFQDEFGASSSPVLVGGLVVLNEDHDVDSFVMALDQKTGRIAWKTPRSEFTRSYSSPLVWNDGDRNQVIVAGSLRLTGYDAQSGEKLWWVDGLSRIVDNTPVIADGHLYVATWTPGGDPTQRISMEPFADALARYDKNNDAQIGKDELPMGAVLQRFFRIDLNQDQKLNSEEWARHAKVFQRAQNVAMSVKLGGVGDLTGTSVKWTHRRGLPTVPSSVLYDGALYMVKDSGIITSLDAQTGQVLKRGRAEGSGNYYASIVAGDGKIYLCSERGVLTVLKAGKQWEVLSSHDFGERIMATPALIDGRIYLRTEKALYCFAGSS